MPFYGIAGCSGFAAKDCRDRLVAVYKLPVTRGPTGDFLFLGDRHDKRDE